MVRQLSREMRDPVRHLDREIATGSSITIKNCQILNGRVGIHLSGARGVLIDGLYAKNVGRPIVWDDTCSDIIVRNLYSENDAVPAEEGPEETSAGM